MLEELTTVPIRKVSRRPIRELDKALMFLKKSMYQEELEGLRSLKEYEMEQGIFDLEV